ncbi:MAG: hypothetical protein JEY99_08210 [Spirochaetales bacterium]|nr:hypothetical protein [Spirochaetales bacterium]
MCIPEYLERNIERILTKEEQNLPAWVSTYDGALYADFEVMKRLKNHFPKKVISRQALINLYRSDDKYLAFVASMVWGFINGSRPLPGHKGDKRTTNLYRMLSHPAEEVEKAMRVVVPYFQKGDFMTPYTLLDNDGPFKIQGVGPAYFTKMFFFAGQAASDKAVPIKPLIFDNWTTNAFFALYGQSNPDGLKEWFTFSKNKSSSLPFSTNPKKGKELYQLYVTSMNCWAESLGIRADKLEEFVFGYSKKPVRENNPRLKLEKITQDNLSLIQ